MNLPLTPYEKVHADLACRRLTPRWRCCKIVFNFNKQTRWQLPCGIGKFLHRQLLVVRIIVTKLKKASIILSGSLIQLHCIDYAYHINSS